MTAIRVIYDGKTFVPQGPVSLPAQAQGMVLVDGGDPAVQARVDAEVREYYQSGVDAEDDAWARAVESGSNRAWDED